MSMRARLLLWSGALTAGALILAWVAISALLSDFVDRRLQAELASSARAVLAASQWDAAGAFSVDPSHADARFEEPLSGWYWQVADGTRVLARSPSLVTGNLGTAGEATLGPEGIALTVHVERFTAPGDGRPLIVTVSLPRAEAAAELGAIRAPLLAALAVLGAALLMAQIIAVRAGLADLTRFARSVAAVRSGGADKVPQPRTSELRPLGEELNRLITANASQLERARAHAGDLAHALKTPMAVLANRARPEDAILIERMERMIRWHLKRARAVAAGLDPSARASLAAVLEDVALVIGPEARRRDVTLGMQQPDKAVFRGDAEDLAEMVGAVAENAVQWSASRVELRVSVDRDALLIEVEDDGPGIAQDRRADLLRRGARLDEATPGHGLGLAIAADRAQLYGGTLELSAGQLGGLKVTLRLPAARQEP
jgi:signal transduction histidine kinase